MIIFCPTRIKPTGGSSSFALKLQQGLRPKGHHLTFKWQWNFDILLANASCPLRCLLYAKLRGKPIVHRLDGVYYPTSVAGRKYRLYNLPLQIILHFFADFVIYQSKYSKYCCEKFLGANRFTPHRLIYNGVDTKAFSNHGHTKRLRDFSEQTIFITASRFRRLDQIDPLVQAFQLFQKKHDPKAKFIIIGNFEQEVAHYPNKHKQDPSLSFLGPISNNKLPALLRSADIFLFSHLNPPCPNNIIEAMACGLPVCGVADGAMEELTTPNLNSELIPAPSDGFKQPRQLDLELFADNMAKILPNKKQYSNHSRILASQNFTLRHMVSQYLDVFKQALSNKVNIKAP